MILGVLGCIDLTMSLSKSLMWYVLISWCKLKGLQPVLIEFNLFIIFCHSYDMAYYFSLIVHTLLHYNCDKKIVKYFLTLDFLIKKW